ncbi:MAG: PTS transporter subunit EIIC [Epulopiscium sp.]|nr:PTS transporter subunit EIIC [Candidatus Epulonipiscium sp.]
MKIVAITACTTGIAHTYMAAEAILQGAKKKGYEAEVETRGSVGVENELTAKAIAEADAVLIASDTAVPMERFVGKRLLNVPVSEAIKDAEDLIERALKAPIYKEKETVKPVNEPKGQGKKKGPYQHLLNGVSFMIPFVVAGGIAIALSFLIGYDAFEEAGTLAAYLKGIGDSAFGLMVPILAGYIAYSIADRPGLALGAIGGMIAVALNSGFLGGIVAGFLGGYTVLLIRKYIRLPKGLQGIMPVLVIPVLGSLFVGLIMYYIVGKPVAAVNTAMNNFLTNLSGSSAIILGLVIGLMMAFDMGGPLNKAAYAFGTGTLVAGQGSMVMAAVMAAGMVPPLALALATILFKDKFTAAEKETGKAAWVLGLGFITEGAIPFAAADPIRVIPSIMLGSAATGALSMLFKCTLSVPHGGIFVFFAVENIVGYIISILIGTVVAALCVGFLKTTGEKKQIGTAL